MGNIQTENCHIELLISGQKRNDTSISLQQTIMSGWHNAKANSCRTISPELNNMVVYWGS